MQLGKVGFPIALWQAGSFLSQNCQFLKLVSMSPYKGACASGHIYSGLYDTVLLPLRYLLFLWHIFMADHEDKKITNVLLFNILFGCHLLILWSVGND
jgi:hypothetical protein